MRAPEPGAEPVPPGGAAGGTEPRSGDRGDRGDANSAAWLLELSSTGSRRDAAVVRLHALLLRIARTEVRRRSAALRLAGPEVDDLAYQAAADALLAITTKLGHFRGESRFTTWAYKFVILEVSTKIGRHFWRHPGVTMDASDWDRLPDRFGIDPADHVQAHDLIAALRHGVEQELTPRQREVFVAIVVHRVPLDALVVEHRTTRNAIYKMMFDARRKLRAFLAANGYLDGPAPSTGVSLTASSPHTVQDVTRQGGGRAAEAVRRHDRVV